MTPIPRCPITIGDTTVDAYLCQCGARVWPKQAYEVHQRQTHGGADVQEKTCVSCHQKKLLKEFVTKDHLFGVVCKDCRRHVDRGSKRGGRNHRAGRPRQYSDSTTVLSKRNNGFRTV